MRVLTFSQLDPAKVNGKLTRKKRGITKCKILLRSGAINLLPQHQLCGFLSLIQNLLAKKGLE